MRVPALALAMLLSLVPAQGIGQDDGDDAVARRVAAFAQAYDAGRYEDAADLGEVALRMSRRAFGDDAQQTGFLMLNLAKVYLRLSRPEEARSLFTDARDLFVEQLGGSSPAAYDAELGLAAAAGFADPSEAAGRYAAVIETMRAEPAVDPVMLANAEAGMARMQSEAGEDGAALATYASAMSRFAEALGAFHPATVQTRAAWAMLQPSRWIAADTLIESWRALRRSLGDSHPEAERVGLAAAQVLLELGLAFDALEVALPLAVWAGPSARSEAAAMLVDAWSTLQNPDAAIRAVRAVLPPEEAEPSEKAAAAAYLATILVRFDRADEAAIALDRARRLNVSTGDADPNLAEALARIAMPDYAPESTLSAAQMLTEATAIVNRLDAAHPRLGELDGLIALAEAWQALATDEPARAGEVARAAVDLLTGADDPRGILRLQLRATQAQAFAAGGEDRLAAVAFNGLEREIATAPVTSADMNETDVALLLTPDEAIDLLALCESYWRDRGAPDRIAGIQRAIDRWRQGAGIWPVPGSAANGAVGD